MESAEQFDDERMYLNIYFGLIILDKEKIMPEISRFYGIIIQMYYNDHSPQHFHATYGEYRATISIKDLNILSGNLPRKGLNLVLDWAELHKSELEKLWELARNEKDLFKIKPLK